MKYLLLCNRDKVKMQNRYQPVFKGCSLASHSVSRSTIQWMYDTILNDSFYISPPQYYNTGHCKCASSPKQKILRTCQTCQIHATYVSHIHGILFYMFMWETFGLSRKTWKVIRQTLSLLHLMAQSVFFTTSGASW